MKRTTRIVAFVLMALAVAAADAAAQLPQASAATLDRGFDPTASGGGFAAIASNPAGLARSDSPGFSLAIPTVSTVTGLGPVTLGDLADWEDRLIPSTVVDDWVGRIRESGGQAGRLSAGATALALTVGPVGFQLSTRASGATDLSPDAAELLLRGNAGADGQPGDFDLTGSGVDAFMVTTAAVSFGIQATEQLHLGLTGKYLMGNGLVVARDGGSFVRSDPLSVELDFPVLFPGEEDYEFNNGTGVGLDLGGLWIAEQLTLGLTIENVFNMFEWDLAGYQYVPGQAVFDVDVKESDFDEAPLADAPASLRRDFESLAEDMTPERRIAVGASYDLAPDLRLFGNVQKSISDGLAFDPDFYGGVGAEWSGLRVLPLRAHVAAITDGFQLGGGASLVLGPVHLSGGVAMRSESTHDSVLGTLALSFGSH